MSVLDTTVIAVAFESGGYGVWANPTAAANAMLVYNHRPTPMESEQVRRQVERGFPGVNPSTYTAIRQRHAFSVELAGSGVVDTAAFWGVLLRGCLFQAPAITVGTRVNYPLDSAGDGGSVSLLNFKGDKLRMRAKGARGNAVFRFEERAIPGIDFDFTGVFQDTLPAEAGVPGTVTLPDPAVGQEVSLLNTVVTLGGIVLGVRSLSIDLGNKVDYFSTTGTRSVVYSKDESGDRRAVTAQAVFELPDPAVKNFFADILPRTELAFSLVHGLTAGNIIEITSARAVLGAAELPVEQNRLFMNCSIEFIPSAAGNELVVITR
jgi:hypothetical protein